MTQAQEYPAVTGAVGRMCGPDCRHPSEHAIQEAGHLGKK